MNTMILGAGLADSFVMQFLDDDAFAACMTAKIAKLRPFLDWSQNKGRLQPKGTRVSKPNPVHLSGNNRGQPESREYGNSDSYFHSTNCSRANKGNHFISYLRKIMIGEQHAQFWQKETSSTTATV